MFIIAQIAGLIAAATNILGIQFKKKRTILMAFIIAGGLFCINYLLLGAYAGGVLTLIGTTQTIISYMYEKKKKEIPKALPAIYIIVTVIASLFTYKSAIDILPLIASVLYALSITQKKEKNLRIMTLCCAICWLIYDVIVGAYTILISDVFFSVSTIIAIFRYDILSKKSKVELVIFDMDGLMLDTESIILKADKYAGERLGYAMTDDLIRKCLGLNDNALKDVYMDTFGKDINFEEIVSVRNEFYDDYVAENGIPKKKGLDEILDFLEKNNIRKAVATSTKKEYAEKDLNITGIIHRFDTIVYGDMVSKSKPNPDIFLKASELCDVPVKNCIVLEDSPHGILGANNAGMRAIMVPDLVEPNSEIEKMLYAKCESLLDVIKVIEKYI